jgi:hypothetical protein
MMGVLEQVMMGGNQSTNTPSTNIIILHKTHISTTHAPTRLYELW